MVSNRDLKNEMLEVLDGTERMIKRLRDVLQVLKVDSEIENEELNDLMMFISKYVWESNAEMVNVDMSVSDLERYC